MNPVNPHLYDVLKNIFADMIDLWTESDVFHMGGDEVIIKLCIKLVRCKSKIILSFRFISHAGIQVKKY